MIMQAAPCMARGILLTGCGLAPGAQREGSGQRQELPAARAPPQLAR
eukprot:COSAG06_NODE_3863_length_4821_cov_12.885006_3_plen_47_part_00